MQSVTLETLRTKTIWNYPEIRLSGLGRQRWIHLFVGESREEFQKRTLEGFQRVVSACFRSHISRAAVVVHGGTIMNIMEAIDIQGEAMTGM